MSRRKLTNLEEIEKAYLLGEISKTTLWRAKKRGWCWVDYHKLAPATAEQRETVLQLGEHLYNYSKAIAMSLLRVHIDIAFYSNIVDIAMELAHSVYLRVLETGADSEGLAFYKVKLLTRQILFRDRYFRRYVFLTKREEVYLKKIGVI